MKKLIILLATSVCILFTSCVREYGHGDVITETRNVENFTKINVTNDATVEIIKGDTLKVEVSDYSNIIGHTKVETKGNTLEIKTIHRGVIVLNSKVKIIITMPDTLKEIEITGSGNVEVLDDFSALSKLQISGSGNITANTSNNLNIIDIVISGSGNITIEGAAKEVNASISGSGNIDCRDLISKTAACVISGSGDISIHATETLDAEITGSGNVNYYGTPHVHSDIDGSGELVNK